MPLKQLHLQPTYNVYQQPDTVETFIWYLTDKRENSIPFLFGWYSQPYPEVLSNRYLLHGGLKLLCTKRGWKEEAMLDLKHVPPFQITVPCQLTSTAKSQLQSLIKSSAHYPSCRQALLTLKLMTSYTKNH